MNVKLRTLHGKDFCAWGDVQLDFSKPGLYRVEGDNRDDPSKGSNGASKTTLMEALRWCLYGSTFKAYKLADDVIRKDADACEVRCTFRANKTLYRVIRSRKRGESTKLMIQQRTKTYDAQAEQTYFGDWTDLRLRKRGGTQEALDEILGMDVRTFSCACLFGQGTTWKFSSLPDRARKEVLEQALGTGTFLQAEQRAKDLAKEWASRGNDAERDEIQAARDVEREEKRRLEAEAASKEREGGDAVDLAVRVADMDVELERLRGLVVVGVRQKFENADDLFREAERRMSRAEKDVDATANAVLRLAKAVESKHDDVCPTCKQELRAPDSVDNVEKARRKAEHEAVAARKDLEDATRRWRDAKADRSAAEKAYEADRKTIEKGQALREKRDGLAADLKVLREGADVYRGQAASAAAARDAAAKHAEICKAEKDRCLNEALFYEVLAKELGPKGAAASALRRFLPHLNEEAERASEDLSDGRLRLKFDLDGDKLDMQVENDCGADSYAGSSMGEQAAVDLCAGLAIQAAVAGRVRTSVVFWDEILDRLDRPPGTRVIGLLRRLAADRAVFLITHAEWAKEFDYDGVYTFVKEGGSARVEGP